MPDYQVKKELCPVTIRMTDGGTLAAGVFLSPYLETTGRGETLFDMLEEDSPFIPVKNMSGHFALVGKKAVSVITIDKKHEPTPEFVKRVRVDAFLSGNVELSGELIVPHGPEFFRVSDYLNQEDVWLRMELEDTVAFLRKEAVKELVL